MADPFSIVSLVMTTLKTINAAKNFVDNVHRAPRSINTLRDELADIEDRLRQLGQITTGERADEQEMHQLLSAPMARCEKISIQVEKMIRPYVKTSGGVNVWGRFAFGFKESEVQLVHRELEGCKHSLSLAITSANLLTDRKTSRGVRRLQNHFGIETSSIATDDIHERKREHIEKYIDETIVEEGSETAFSDPEKPPQWVPSPNPPNPTWDEMKPDVNPFVINVQHNNRAYPVRVHPNDTIEMVKRKIRSEHLDLIQIKDLESEHGDTLEGSGSIEYYCMMHGLNLKAILSVPVPQKAASVAPQSLPASKLVHPAQVPISVPPQNSLDSKGWKTVPASSIPTTSQNPPASNGWRTVPISSPPIPSQAPSASKGWNVVLPDRQRSQPSVAQPPAPQKQTTKTSSSKGRGIWSILSGKSSKYDKRCDECGETFQFYTALHDHRDKEHNAFRKGAQVNGWEPAPSRNYNKEAVTNVHYDGNAIPNECSDCGWFFESMNDFRKHRRRRKNRLNPCPGTHAITNPKLWKTRVYR